MRAGLTLVEVVVFTALSLLLLVLMGKLLFPSLRASRRASVQVELQQMATQALVSLGNDLGRCNGGSVSILNGAEELSPGGLAFTRSAGLTSSGSRLWEERATFVIWLPAQRRLISQDYPPEPPAQAKPLLPSVASRFSLSDLNEVANQANRTRRSLASEVEAFHVSHEGGEGPHLIPPLTVRLKLQKKIPSGQVESFELVRKYALRN